jgi:hypothetical protein
MGRIETVAVAAGTNSNLPHYSHKEVAVEGARLKKLHPEMDARKRNEYASGNGAGRRRPQSARALTAPERHHESPSEPAKASAWDVDSAEIEALIAEVEEDRLPYGVAMGELLRALYGLSQTLNGLEAGSARAASPPEDKSSS